MKKKIAKTILSLLSAVAIFGLSSLSYTVKAEGWIRESEWCLVGETNPIFIEIEKCDAWGGDCPDQYCCDY